MEADDSRGTPGDGEEIDIDEPTFVLLARDPMAPKLVRLWAAQKYVEHEDPEKIEEARACADAMDRWLESFRKDDKR